MLLLFCFICCWYSMVEPFLIVYKHVQPYTITPWQLRCIQQKFIPTIGTISIIDRIQCQIHSKLTRFPVTAQHHHHGKHKCYTCNGKNRREPQKWRSERERGDEKEKNRAKPLRAQKNKSCEYEKKKTKMKFVRYTMTVR